MSFLHRPSLRIITGLVLCLVTGSALYGLQQYSLRTVRGQTGWGECYVPGNCSACPSTANTVPLEYGCYCDDIPCVPEGSSFWNGICGGGSCLPSCWQNGSSCTANNDCCSQVCVNGSCAASACIQPGQPCGGPVSCCSGLCSQGTCPVSSAVCGNGNRESGEQCDDGNTENGDCCSSDCKTVSAGIVCRAAVAGDCDVAEVCTANGTCPADAKKTSGTACADDGNACTADTCNGTSDACQHPAGNAGTVCRASTNLCDPAEVCTGSSNLCPTDTNDCGLPVCGNGTVQTGEQCDGGACCNSNCTLKTSGTACADDGNACTADTCNGTSDACQHPAGNAGAVCRASTKLSCDPPEKCSGTEKTCPLDVNSCATSSISSSSTAPCLPHGAACTKHSACCSLLCTGMTGQQKCQAPSSSSQSSSSSSHPSQPRFCCAVSPSATSPEYACVATDNDENFTCVNFHQYDSAALCKQAEILCNPGSSSSPSSSSSNNIGAFVVSCSPSVVPTTATTAATTAEWGDIRTPPPLPRIMTRMTQEEPTDGDKSSMLALCALSPEASVCCSTHECSVTNANECTQRSGQSFANMDDCEAWVKNNGSC